MSLCFLYLSLEKDKIKHVTIGCFETINKTKDHPSLGLSDQPSPKRHVMFSRRGKLGGTTVSPFFCYIYW